VRPQRAVAIMTYQVTAADYRRCVLDRECPAAAGAGDGDDRPAVEVSWRDAEAYARWPSHRLGARYRLPTDEEWVSQGPTADPSWLPLGA